MFGYKLIRTKDYDRLIKHQLIVGNVYRCKSWFGAWPELKHLFDYILTKHPSEHLFGVRARFAEARGTDWYGEALPIERQK